MKAMDAYVRGLTATKLGEFDQADPALAGGAAERYVKVYSCSPGGPVTYDAAAQAGLPANAELPYADFQGGFGKTLLVECGRLHLFAGGGLN